MSSAGQISLRYARALMQLTEESGSTPQVLTQLRQVSQLISANKEFKEFFASPLVDTKAKESAVKESLKSAELQPDLSAFIGLVTKNDRMSLLPEIAQQLEKLLDTKNGVTRGQVVSSVVLSPEERQQVQEIVSKVTKKQVVLSYKENPDLIGGLRAQVGSYVFDDSLMSHLNRLKDTLKKRRLN